MKKYNQYIMFILFITTIFINIIFVINSIHYQTRTINNSYQLLDENIVFFGDSITYLYNLPDYYNNQNMVNIGVKSDKTEELINRINDVYKYNPSKVFILIGINDLIKKIEPDDIINNYSIIIDSITENRRYAKIYVESIYPINIDIIRAKEKEGLYHMDNEMIIELNNRIKELCNEKDVTYINVYDSLTDSNGYLKELYTTDGLHISNLGYLKITTLLNKYIKGD